MINPFRDKTGKFSVWLTHQLVMKRLRKFVTAPSFSGDWPRIQQAKSFKTLTLQRVDP